MSEHSKPNADVVYKEKSQDAGTWIGLFCFGIYLIWSSYGYYNHTHNCFFCELSDIKAIGFGTLLIALCVLVVILRFIPACNKPSWIKLTQKELVIYQGGFLPGTSSIRWDSVGEFELVGYLPQIRAMSPSAPILDYVRAKITGPHVTGKIRSEVCIMATRYEVDIYALLQELNRRRSEALVSRID